MGRATSWSAKVSIYIHLQARSAVRLANSAPLRLSLWPAAARLTLDRARSDVLSSFQTSTIRGALFEHGKAVTHDALPDCTTDARARARRALAPRSRRRAADRRLRPARGARQHVALAHLFGR